MMAELFSLLMNQNLNSVAVYETLPLIDTNYWELNKHLFVSDIVYDSIETIDKFYKYVVLIQEQHLLQTQKNLGNAEYKLLTETFDTVIAPSINSASSNELPKFDENLFWKTYNIKQSLFKNIISNGCFTEYVSKQTSLTASTIFTSYALLEITGCQGYRKLREIAKM